MELSFEQRMTVAQAIDTVVRDADERTFRGEVGLTMVGAQIAELVFDVCRSSRDRSGKRLVDALIGPLRRRRVILSKRVSGDCSDFVDYFVVLDITDDDNDRRRVKWVGSLFEPRDVSDEEEA